MNVQYQRYPKVSNTVAGGSQQQVAILWQDQWLISLTRIYQNHVHGGALPVELVRYIHLF